MTDELAARREDKRNAKRRNRPVLVSDVLPYAARDCTDCGGHGYTDETLCDCAERRFQQLHCDLLEMKDGVMWWKAS